MLSVLGRVRDPEGRSNGLCMGLDTFVEGVFDTGGDRFGFDGFFYVSNIVGFDALNHYFGDFLFGVE